MAVQAAETVDVTIRDFVAQVEFARPPSNFFDIDLLETLAETFEALDDNPEVRATVLASAGAVFCAGADFATQGDAAPDTDAVYRQALRLFHTRKPIVAAIQGAAVGGGLGLAMIADFRIVSSAASFSANFVKIGIHPGFGLTHTLPRVVGRQTATMMLLTGRRITAAQAEEIGLADAVGEPAELHADAWNLAREIAQNAPLAVLATRATLRSEHAEAVAAQISIEASEQTRLFWTSDFKEGVRAVRERRSGNWSGA